MERANATVEMVLKKELEGAIHDWPDYIPFVQLVCKEKTSAITRASPFSLMFGRSLNSFDKYGTTQFARAGAAETLKHQAGELHDTIYSAVNDRVRMGKMKMKDAFNKTHKMLSEDSLPPGAIVMMLDKTRTSKWAPEFEGPFMVIRKNRGGAYELRNKIGEILKRKVPADQLKLVQRRGDKAAFKGHSYEIKGISDHRTTNTGKLEYYMTWKDLEIEPGWELVEHFDDIDHTQVLEIDSSNPRLQAQAVRTWSE